MRNSFKKQISINSGHLTPKQFGAPLDGVSDSSAALAAAASAAAKTGRALFIDRPYAFNTTWNLPANLTLLGDCTPNSKLIFKGTSLDGIVATGAINVHGITIDGNMTPGGTRLVTQLNALFGVHGPIDLVSPYLDRVNIGYLRIQNTNCSGLVVANIQNMNIGHLELQTIYGPGSFFTGLTGAYINTIIADDIGNLKKLGSRQGTAVAVMTETKPVAPWYDHTGMKPTNGITFDNIIITRTTDSAYYMHDDWGTGVTNVHIKNISVDTAGKDAVKTRNGPTYTRFDNVKTNKSGLRGLDIESDHTTVGTVTITNSGYDAVGDIMGTPSNYSGGDDTGQTVNTGPEGLTIGTCNYVTINSINITGIKSATYDGSEGHGIRMYQANHVTINNSSVTTCDANGLRMSGCDDVTINLHVTDACRNGTTGQMVYINSDGYGNSTNSNLTLTIAETSGSPVATYAYYASGDNITKTIVYTPSQFKSATPIRDNAVTNAIPKANFTYKQNSGYFAAMGF